MTARIIDGRALAAVVRDAVAKRARQFALERGRAIALAAVSVGDDAAQTAYARAKRRAAESCGLAFRHVALVSGADTEGVVRAIEALNADPQLDGIIVELPLPAGLEGRRIIEAIDPARDVDGVTATSRGRLLGGAPGPRPATAAAVLEIVRSSGVVVEGASVTIIGRSPIVGLPAALLLLASHATVTVAHTRTRALADVARGADILVVAAGVPGLVGAAHIKSGALVVDVGTNVVRDGDATRIVGDVDFDAAVAVAGAITPVPGGVGPLTTAIALRTTIELAEARA